MSLGSWVDGFKRTRRERVSGVAERRGGKKGERKESTGKAKGKGRKGTCVG